MKKAYFQYRLVFITGLVIFMSCQNDSNSILPFIRRVTKISLPNNISIISEFDQGELEAGGKYRLQQKDIRSFLSKNNFHPIDQQCRDMSHFNLMGKAGLFPPADTIPLSDTSHLEYLYGCKEGNSWLFTLNEKSGELWIEVQYPDFQGQGPARNF
ncbi:hypothetical protein [Chitinophaga ginsengisoli]|uniref:Lipoprotein n=1 Tax=Chitinophaga ginsengisoli TaxID=363837 RepID=A0A2P8FNK1_9BACT|nr:hypothetical protein [Chitinophaga ginsengisoli]PSL23297.1 hypothetical protein CLV42_11812 [Chitinophaga ginsengisoli]